MHAFTDECHCVCLSLSFFEPMSAYLLLELVLACIPDVQDASMNSLISF
jgi:hypothetical protein